MTPEQIIDFLKKAVTRSGAAYTVTHLQHSPDMSAITLKGTVEYEGQDVQMIWDAKTGRALTDNRGFDLVIETCLKDIENSFNNR